MMVNKLLEKQERQVDKYEKIKKLHLQKKKRALKKVVGTTEKPRLAVLS